LGIPDHEILIFLKRGKGYGKPSDREIEDACLGEALGNSKSKK